MPIKIGADNKRFHDIIRGRVRKDLKRFISQEGFKAKQGNKTVSVPIHNVDTPVFRYDDKKQGGTGQGDGDPGDPMGGNGQQGPGKGKAGQGEGDKGLEVEVTIDELADMLGEELDLPRIENKGKSKILQDSHKYRTIRRQGPEGLRNFKRTYKEALKREISSGSYNPGYPVIPRKEDKRYRAADVVEDTIANACIIYMMDVSGSMGEEQKSIARITSFWINAWIRKHFKGLETRYIIHDTTAKEVSEEDFFRTAESGGTQISSAYRLCADIMNEEYPATEWNIYTFHFSDGDNWSHEDNEKALDIVRKEILPFVSQFAYGQIKSGYGSGDFYNVLQAGMGNEPGMCLSKIEGKDGILSSIKDFLKSGR